MTSNWSVSKRSMLAKHSYDYNIKRAGGRWKYFKFWSLLGGGVLVVQVDQDRFFWKITCLRESFCVPSFQVSLRPRKILRDSLEIWHLERSAFHQKILFENLWEDLIRLLALTGISCDRKRIERQPTFSPTQAVWLWPNTNINPTAKTERQQKNIARGTFTGASRAETQNTALTT